MKRLALLGALLGLAAQPGCSAIGDPGGVPDGLPHGGTGAFRLLDTEETGIRGALPGRAVVVLNDAIGAASVTESSIVYARAPLLEDPPMLPEDHPAPELFRPAFGPWAIWRGPARDEGVGAYDAGSMILEATEAWEGAEVFDPWMVVDPDGTVRLYYAAEGGIGLAEASSEEGPFTKLDGPVLDTSAAGSGAPRRPSVVRATGDVWFMYYDRGDGIGLATSTDGRSWGLSGTIDLSGEDEGESPEVRVGNPGAVRVETSADRWVVRLYFESFREDGTHHVYMAGSFDGATFERWPREVIDNTDVRFPAPRQVDTRVTFLYLNLGFFGGPFQTRGLSVSVAPAGQRFDPPEQ